MKTKKQSVPVLTGFNQAKLLLDLVERQLKVAAQAKVVVMKNAKAPGYFRMCGELAAYKHALAIVQMAKKGLK